MRPFLFLGTCGNCTILTPSPTIFVAPTPTILPSFDQCEEIVPCGEDGNIKYCIPLESGADFEACLPQSRAPEIVPEFGGCGECPEAPSMSPTAGPSMSPTTAAPTMSPTGFLDGCVVEPPSCSIVGDGTTEEDDGVTFCFVLESGKQVDLCVLPENVIYLLARGEASVPMKYQSGAFSWFRISPLLLILVCTGYCGPCIEPPSFAPTGNPTAVPTAPTPTLQPSDSPSAVFPTTEPTQMPTTIAPSAAPSEDPLAGCDPVISCGDGGVVFCVEGETEEDYIEICLPVCGSHFVFGDE